jgi:hypothetical protein
MGRWICGSQHFEEPYCIHLQGSLDSMTLEDEVLQSFETSETTFSATQRHIYEDPNPLLIRINLHKRNLGTFEVYFVVMFPECSGISCKYPHVINRHFRIFIDGRQQIRL